MGRKVTTSSNSEGQRRSDIFRDLHPVELTEQEVLTYGRRLAELHRQRAEVVEEFTDVKSEYKDRLQHVDDEISGKAGAVRTGKENREVDCCWVFDDQRNTATLMRLDTGELLNTRPQTDAERQVRIPEE